jgi:nitrogen regulatory protein PII 1
MILMVVEDKNVDHVIALIKDGAYTGNFGDGKVFVSPVEEAYTVRTGTKGL